MKKALSLLLVLVLCLGLCACGGEQSGETNSGGSQETEMSGVEDTGKALVCSIGWNLLSCPADMFDLGIELREDGTFFPAAGGDQYGTWTMAGDTVSMTWTNYGQTFDYQLKSYGDIYFLIGEQDTLTSVSEREIPSTVSTEEVKITMDNWQEYFEFITFSQTIKAIDLFGNASEETTTYGILKLKDEYARHVVRIVSTASASFAISGAQHSTDLQEGMMNSVLDRPEPGGRWGKFVGERLYYYGVAVELDETQENDASFEMLQIEGTLYFIDIE